MPRFVQLERRFLPWTEQDQGDPEDVAYLLASREALSWVDLLERSRVVVLAEAGSGKSTELEEQARANTAAGKYTFRATVQSVGNRGLGAALGVEKTQQFEQWRRSDQPAWFFFDSVDEAKANNVRLQDALQNIAEAIRGAEARAHIVISGRHTDWEFRRDLEHLEEWLPPPSPSPPLPSIDPNELLVSVIRRERPPETPKPEVPLVVVMAALDPKQVGVFAGGMGVEDVSSFVTALDSSNLWSFARRPLDLGWLVEYWRTKRRLGSLAEMLALSLRERLREPEPQRDRRDPLSIDHAFAALERIGAALTLLRIADIAIPDSSLELTGARPSLDLSRILPDWSGEDRTRLLSRAVFDPAAAGFARLHNDNSGVVRGYLTARWLKRLLESNCPKSIVNDLLFARTYGIDVVIPSMRQSAAWLSLWDADVAREIGARDPRLLMDAGDPASLPLEARPYSLTRFADQLAQDGFLHIPDRDSLKRFALPDIATCIREIWALHSESPAVRELLLLLIEMGSLTACSDIAVQACFGSYDDRYTQVFSGRALIATGSTADKQRYIDFVKAQAASLPNTAIWDLLEALFPAALSVGDLVQILSTIPRARLDEGLGLQYYGPKIAEQVTSIEDASSLLIGILDMLEAKIVKTDEQGPAGDEAFLPTVHAAGLRLLELSLSTEAPALAIDAALRVAEDRSYRRRLRGGEKEKNIFSLLQADPQRRRASLWRASEVVVNPKDDTPIDDAWQLEIIGFPIRLVLEDFDWLLDDIEHRPTERERRIAASAALRVWNENGRPEAQLARIRRLADIHHEVAAVVEEWTRPRPASDRRRDHERRIRQIDRRNAADAARRDQSWLDFADRLRSDPEQLRAIGPPSSEGVNARLYHLWQLLNDVSGSRSRYAIDDLAPLEPILGAEVVAALRDAFIAYWRRWTPKLRSERDQEARNTINALDCIGIVGVTLEARADPNWAAILSERDASVAAKYATLELNGFPAWITSLALAQPEALRNVLVGEIVPELESRDAADAAEVLQDIARADAAVSGLVADDVFDHVANESDLPPKVLASALDILGSSYSNREALASLLRQRFVAAGSIAQAAVYYEAYFSIDPAQGVSVLDAKLDGLSPSHQTQLAQAILPTLAGDRLGHKSFRPTDIPFDCLARLVRIAYRTIRLEDDNRHPSGETYSYDDRDYAEQARSALFKVLVDTPGAATFHEIERLANDPEFTVPALRMREIARGRAEEDSEHEVWTSAEVHSFQEDFERSPRTPAELQRLVLFRLGDLQHDLLNTDYAQGETVSGLPNEVDVQNWMADRLRLNQGRSYSVEREPHVAGEKEPDVRFRAKATDANVPMEIKVAGSWSLPQLEDALRIQLAGRYLRDRLNRHGILLLVHQKSRPRGWQYPTGRWLTFSEVVDHLRRLTRAMAEVSPEAPHASIAVIDVSSAYSPAKQAKRTKTKGRRKAQRAYKSDAPNKVKPTQTRSTISRY